MIVPVVVASPSVRTAGRVVVGGFCDLLLSPKEGVFLEGFGGSLFFKKRFVSELQTHWYDWSMVVFERVVQQNKETVNDFYFSEIGHVCLENNKINDNRKGYFWGVGRWTEGTPMSLPKKIIAMKTPFFFNNLKIFIPIKYPPPLLMT